MKASKLLFTGFLCLLFFCNATKGIELPTPPSVNLVENKTITQIFEYIEKEAKQAINRVIKMALPTVLEYSDKINVSAECRKDAFQVFNGVRNLKAWAIQFLDASGKFPDGVMSGSVTAIGNYDECLDIDVKSTNKKDEGKTIMVGQYCMIEARIKDLRVKKPPGHRMFIFPEEMKDVLKSDTIVGHFAPYIYYMDTSGVRVAACVPSGCKEEDINSLLKTITDGTPLNATVLQCEVREENEYTVPAVLVIALYSFITFVVLASSLFDYYSVCNNLIFKSKAIRCFLAFSLYANFSKMYAVGTRSNSLRCLNGIKFFGITWVILGHTAVTLLAPQTHGLFRIKEYTEDISFQVIVNATFSVDTFFFTGSFLLSYFTIKLCKVDGKKFNLPMYIIHRIWRIYPAYFLTLTLAAVLPLMGSGPGWSESTGKMIQFCYDNWWASLFFVNNIYKPTESCWPHTWYVTVDMQLYILALIFIIPLIKWPRVGLSFLFLGMVSSILWCGISTYINDYPPTILFSLMDVDESLDYFYYFFYTPLTHLSPYVLGIFVGYVFAVHPNFKMSRTTKVVGWISAVILSLSALYGSIGWYKGEMPYFLLILYASFCRTAWQLGVAWMIYSCITGNGGWINTLLSWRVFVPLGRLSYCAYLIHLMVMIVFYGSFKTRLQPDVYVHIWLWSGHLCASYGIAVIMYLFVEVPFAKLEHILLLERDRKVEDPPKEKNIVVEGLKTSEKNGNIGNIIIITPSIDETSNKI